MPSVVRYGEAGVKNMGEDALACADTDPFNTVFSVKRLMGRGYKDVQGLNLPYPRERFLAAWWKLKPITAPKARLKCLPIFCAPCANGLRPPWVANW